MTGHKLPSSFSQSCSCTHRLGHCRWFKCGQPGPQEHAYKCEVFYATAGNFYDQPARLRNISLLVAHVLGYSDAPPHTFGSCGRLWTLGALLYRLRDGPLSSSMAALLTPRPVPVSLVATLQKLAKNDKPYRPRSHFLDTNPFSGLHVGRHGVERKLSLSHVSLAVWRAHASWLARSRLGNDVDWALWKLDHIAPPPAKLLGEEDRTHPTTHAQPHIKRSASVSFLNDLPRRTPLVVVNHAPTPSGTTDDSSTHSSPRPQTPQHIRPRSFAGYSGWGLGASPGTGTEPLALNKHRLSCVLDGTRPLPPRPSLPPFMEQSPVRAHHAHGIMVLQTENESTYFLANETFSDELPRLAFPGSPLRA